MYSRSGSPLCVAILQPLSHLANIPTAPPTSVCPGGEPEVDCRESMCAESTCDGVDSANCVVDRCGACSVRWFKDGVEVTDQCEGTHLWHLLPEALENQLLEKLVVEHFELGSH